MKAYNILKTIFILLVREKATVKSLAIELEVSERTVKRYLADIMCLDMPVYTQPGKNGGIYFDKQAFYDRYRVTSKELDLIIDAVYANKSMELLFSGNQLDFSELLKRLKVNNIVEVDFSKWCQDTKYDLNFSTIKRGICASQKIEFDYYDMYNRPSHRVINPYKIGFKEHDWYVLGICNLRKEKRVFKMRKMRNVKLLTDTFQKDAYIAFDFSNFFSTSNKVVLCMEISKKSIAKVYEDFDPAEIEEYDDMVKVTSTRVNNPSLMSLVLSYGANAKVISPEEMIDKVIAHVKSLEEIYKR